jgi:subtilisin
MSSQSQGWLNNERRGVATVTIVDVNNNAVDGATVTGIWSGLATNSVSGTTNNQGKVTLYSSWVPWWPSGTFTFTVTDVTKPGWIYDSSSNVETSGSVTV